MSNNILKFPKYNQNLVKYQASQTPKFGFFVPLAHVSLFISKVVIAIVVKLKYWNESLEVYSLVHFT